MTFRRVQRGRWHSYEAEGKRVPGVTTMIGAGVPKPNLIDWAAKMAAEYAADNVDTITGMERSAAIDLIKSAHSRSRNFAGIKGTEIHGIAQQLAAGQSVNVPDTVAGYVDGYVAFVDDWQPITYAVEAPIVNRRRNYAGTFDLLCGLNNGELVSLVDIKTGGSGVWPETCLQIAAYRAAETMLDPDGKEVPMPHTDAGHALWLGDDGSYELLPVESGPDIFAVFLHVCRVAAFMGLAKDHKDDLIGLPLAPPVARLPLGTVPA